jgi:hypothetical protein
VARFLLGAQTVSSFVAPAVTRVLISRRFLLRGFVCNAAASGEFQCKSNESSRAGRAAAPSPRYARHVGFAPDRDQITDIAERQKWASFRREQVQQNPLSKASHFHLDLPHSTTLARLHGTMSIGDIRRPRAGGV